MKNVFRALVLMIAIAFCATLFVPFSEVQAAGITHLSKSRYTMTTGTSGHIKLLSKTGKTISDRKIKWKSSNRKVATVTSGGTVKAVKSGKATITAKYRGKTYKCRVTVKNATLRTRRKTLSTGQKYVQKLYDANGKRIDARKIKWSSSNKWVATVSSNGVIRAKNPGTAKIYAKYKGVTYTTKCTVKYEAVILSKNTITINSDQDYYVDVTFNGTGSIYYTYDTPLEDGTTGNNGCAGVRWGGEWNGNTIRLYVSSSIQRIGKEVVKIYGEDNPSDYKLLTLNVLPHAETDGIYEFDNKYRNEHNLKSNADVSINPSEGHWRYSDSLKQTMDISTTFNGGAYAPNDYLNDISYVEVQYKVRDYQRDDLIRNNYVVKEGVITVPTRMYNSNSNFIYFSAEDYTVASGLPLAVYYIDFTECAFYTKDGYYR